LCIIIIRFSSFFQILKDIKFLLMFYVVSLLTGTAGATGVAIDSALGSLSEKVSEHSDFLYRSYHILFFDFTSSSEYSV
jgi:hypothetical protein